MGYQIRPAATLLLPVLAAGMLALARGAAADPACVRAALYRSGFETGSGLADWTVVGLLSDAPPYDWQGIQACPAHGGEQLFRYGGTSCDGAYSADQRALAQPSGASGLAVPAGASATRLAFWHRWAFETNHDGALVAVKVDSDPVYYLAKPDAIMDGTTGYNGQLAGAPACPVTPIGGLDVFTGHQNEFTETVVDLDAVCDLATGGTGGCAGHTIQVGFAAFSNCEIEDAGWFLDDVLVTACSPPGALDLYTLDPCRLVDTRGPPGPLGGPALAAGEERTFSLAGQCGLQEPVQVVSLNLTVTQPQSSGQLQLFAGGEPAPETGTLSFGAGQTRANNAMLRLSADGLGRLVVRNDSTGEVHVTLDVNAYLE